MIPKDKQAAQLLEGKILEGGWRVTKKLDKPGFGTGGVYSSCYEVENEDRKGFLKAFDYSGAEKVGKNFALQLVNILNAFKIEREILEICTQKNCKNVIRLMEHGEFDVVEADKYPRVEYLILEFAEKGDVRDMLNKNSTTMEWKIRSLHQLAKGLHQIHTLEIAHQDIKPSNIVTLKDDLVKLTDFGSAVNVTMPLQNLPHHLTKAYAGSYEYAPPELLYGEIDGNQIQRRIGCDLYLLGSMVCFYYTGMSMTSLIKLNLDDTLCWTDQSTQGKYNEVKAYLIQAYEKALEDIRISVNDEEIQEKIVLVVRYLCHPENRMRGHEKTIQGRESNYSLARFITLFDQVANYYFKKGK